MLYNNFALFTFFLILRNNGVLLWTWTYVARCVLPGNVLVICIQLTWDNAIGDKEKPKWIGLACENDSGSVYNSTNNGNLAIAKISEEKSSDKACKNKKIC
jgi:hypothetical protein